jgi:Domain of unknown function (DUF4410)
MRLVVYTSLVAVILALAAPRGPAQDDIAPNLAPQQSAQQSSQQPSQPGAQQSTQQTSAPAPAPPPPPEAARSKIVYVTDFELDAVDANGKLEKNVPAVSVANPGPSPTGHEPGPADQAGRLIDFMSITLMKELEKAGYSAHRLRPSDTRPTDGIRISGIFGEPDEQNRLRRAVLGTFTNGKMSLFVGISNLARPDQALYAPADPASGNKAGAVITVTSYAPVARFDMDKNTTEKAVKDTATGIVANLGALLSANVVALTQ